MTRIPEEDRDMIEKAIYYPMVISILNKDLAAIHEGSFKLKEPYIHLIEKTMKTVQQELADVKQYMRKNHMKVYKVKNDEAFTMYAFIYKGFEEHHSYFNPRIRNKVLELMEYYLSSLDHH